MKSPIKYMTPEELIRLFRVIDSARDRAIFRLAYHRGLRAGEIRKLMMDDWRPTSGRLFVHRLKNRKKNTSGEYLLTEVEIKALRSWLRERGGDPGPIFVSNRRTAISKQMLDVLIKKYCEAAKIPADKAHMHALRHSCATSLMEQGEDIAVVKDHLGHASVTSTEIYAAITNRRRDEVGKRLKTWK